MDITIGDLAAMVARIVGYDGGLEWDASKPDGTPRKLLDVTKLSDLGWEAEISLEDGVRSTYEWFVRQHATARL
jgi:GDP-L-fucose synthase